MGCDMKINKDEETGLTDVIRFSDGEGCACLAPYSVQVYEKMSEADITMTMLFGWPPDADVDIVSESEEAHREVLRQYVPEEVDRLEVMDALAQGRQDDEVMDALKQDEIVEKVSLTVLKEKSSG